MIIITITFYSYANMQQVSACLYTFTQAEQTFKQEKGMYIVSCVTKEVTNELIKAVRELKRDHVVYTASITI